jgi:hypothetical protein
VKYLRKFLEQGSSLTDRTDERQPKRVLSVLSVAHPKEPEVHAEVSLTRTSPVDDTALCTECNRPTWLSLVAHGGERACIDCLTGRTAMRARGVPL